MLIAKTPEATLRQLADTGRVKEAVLDVLRRHQQGDDPKTLFRLTLRAGAVTFHRGDRREFVNPGTDENAARMVLRAALGRGVNEKRIARLTPQFMRSDLFGHLRNGGCAAGEVSRWAEGR